MERGGSFSADTSVRIAATDRSTEIFAAAPNGRSWPRPAAGECRLKAG